MKSGASQPSQSVQRVKVGMIGLAAVILLIGLASAIFSAANRDRPLTGIGAPKSDLAANLIVANDTAADEPLAELGVAPSAVDANTAAPTPEATR